MLTLIVPGGTRGLTQRFDYTAAVVETYRAIGHASSWAALMVYPVLRLATICWPWKKIPRRFSKGDYIASAACIIVGGFGLPMEPSIGIGCIVGATCIPLMKSPKFGSKMAARLAFSTYFVIMGCFFCYMGTLDTRMILDDERVVFTDFRGTDSVPRLGLKVEAVSGKRHWWESRSWCSWTTFSGQKLGPDLTGFTWYWGPHGFEYGDAVGQRLAEWAGVKPYIVPSIHRQ